MAEKKIVVVGSSNTDMTIKGGKLPAPGETVTGGLFYMGPGGKGANQAVAAKRLGADVIFICKVGSDLFGDNAIAGYKREGIDTSKILRSSKASGTALILVDAGGENCISVAPGANCDLSVEDIDSIAPVIRKADILLLQLEIPMPSVVKAARIANEAGAYVILNPAPACELPPELLKNVSLIIPNQTETALLSGVSCLDEEGLIDAVAKIRAMGVADVVVTLGSKGSMVFSGDKIDRIPAEIVQAVDTTAAGDTFCGAIAVGLSEDMSLPEAAAFATKASAITVQRIGAQNSIPYRKDLI